MSEVVEFIAHYAAPDRAKIAFSWNGKHASEFVDANQEFRWEVVKQCFEKPGVVPTALLEALFLADADWAKQAWGAPHHFAQLAGVLLERDGAAVLETFSVGLNASFDTFGACHELQLPPELLISLTASAQKILERPLEERQRICMESALELFKKMKSSTATAGWAKIASGTQVSDVKIVRPRWYHTMGAWLSQARRR
jgi:hypothetical protein